MTNEALPASLAAIMNGTGAVQSIVTVTLTTEAMRLLSSWAAAQGQTLDGQISEILEARAQEDLQTMTEQEIADLT